jgi:hypothetical protein
MVEAPKVSISLEVDFAIGDLATPTEVLTAE